MRITLIGYGKMGKTIEKIAKQRNHEISHIIEYANIELLDDLTCTDTDIAIEFTRPKSAVENLKKCMSRHIPVVCGTTGWLERRAEVEQFCIDHHSAFFYASNFSLGVNLFFQLNKYLAKLMSNHPEYQISMEEIHHTQKKDAPSGTAITLAEDLIQFNPQKTRWVNELSTEPTALPIISKRQDSVPGTHSILYQSKIDEIEIKHTAHSREGFAIGAVTAAEWLKNKKGNFGMEDLIADLKI